MAHWEHQLQTTPFQVSAAFPPPQHYSIFQLFLSG